MKIYFVAILYYFLFKLLQKLGYELYNYLRVL